MRRLEELISRRGAWWEPVGVIVLCVCLFGCVPRDAHAQEAPPASDAYATDGFDVDGSTAFAPEIQAYLDALYEIQVFLRAHQVGRWQALADCESGGDWSIVSRSGRYRGGLQMTLTFWRTYGGPEFASSPELAEPWQQAEIADRHVAAVGNYRAWPACSRRLGLR